MAERTERCENCPFWRELTLSKEEDRNGFCQRFPPSMVHSENCCYPEGWHQPIVTFDMRCGEWQGEKLAASVPSMNYIDMPIKEFCSVFVSAKFFWRIYRTMWWFDINTVGELTHITAEKLSTHKGFGKGALKALRLALAKINLTLRDHE